MAQRGRPSKNKQDIPATPQQLEQIDNSVKQLTGQTFDEFCTQFTDENKRKMFTEQFVKQFRQLDSINLLSSCNGQYQPITSEKLFQQMNINPKAISSDDIEQCLLAPQHNDKKLRHLSQYLTYAVGQYQRSIWYLNNIKSYNYKLIPCNSNIEEKIDTKSFMHSYDICLRTLEKMNIKYQIPKVDLQVMQEGISFVWVSETKDNITLLPLPTDYCYITAPWTMGFLFAIDLTIFDTIASVPIQIPELYNAYQIFCDMRSKKIDDKNIMIYQYYHVPPEKGWVFTFDPIHPDKVPPLTSSMSPALDVLSYRALLKNKSALDLFKVIAMKIPMNKDGTTMAISYQVAEEITQAIQALLPENIRAYSAPFESESINTDQSDKYSNIVDTASDIYFSSVGLQKVQFGGGDVKTGSALTSAAKVDFAFASYHMYRQYENFVNWQLAIKTKAYKFKIQMFGDKLNEEKEIQQAMEVVRTCNTNVTHLFSVLGYEPYQVKSLLLMEEMLGYKNLMTPLVSAYNTSSTSSSCNGKPETLDSDKSDSGLQTADNQSNENRV